MGTKYKKNEARGAWITYVWDGTYDADGRKHRKWIFSKKSSADLDSKKRAFMNLLYCTELCYQIPSISTKMIAKLLGDNERMVLDVYSHLQEEREDLSGAIQNGI